MRKFILSILLLTLIGGGFWLFRGGKEEEISIDTAIVTRGDLVKAISATGTLEAVNTVNVGTQVSGTIKKVYVDYNRRVRKGQLIAEIDPDLLEANVRKARADVLAAKANLQEAQATVNDARRTRDRSRELLERDLIAKSEYDAAQTGYETSLARLSAAKAKVAQVEADLKYREITLGYTRITSPIDGVIIDRAVDEGQTVNASQSAPTLFIIAEDLTKMQVEADIDEADIGQVKIGQVVEFTVDSYPDASFEGKVEEIRLAPSTSENVVTYTVIVKVDNPDLRLMPGMTANVSVISGKRENVLKVASSALRFSPDPELLDLDEGSADAAPFQGRKRGSGEMGSLWVLMEGRFVRIPVRTGISDGMYTEVSGDISDKSEVVTGVSGSFSSRGRNPFGFGRRR